MTTVDDTLFDDDYDEFALLHENASEWDIPFEEPPTVRRVAASETVAGLSYLQWGDGPPEVVFLHGGGQNAHTWDTVALALGRPAIAFDLLGHGRSPRRDDRNYGPWNNADAVAAAMAELGTGPVVVVGMSLGGATNIRLTATHPELVRRAVIVDVTPAVNDPSREMSTIERGSVALIAGPPTYESFDEMADAAVALSPYRAASGVRRGVRHNSYRRADGLWTWRYDLFGPPPAEPATPVPDIDVPGDARSWADFTTLWDDVEAITVPTVLVRGGLSKYVLDEDEAEMRRRLPGIRVELVDGAGHAVQSDRPLELVELIEQFGFGG
jgi:pimeloyl-ACP methyl ester carboxylesterase